MKKIILALLFVLPVFASLASAQGVIYSTADFKAFYASTQPQNVLLGADITFDNNPLGSIGSGLKSIDLGAYALSFLNNTAGDGGAIANSTINFTRGAVNFTSNRGTSFLGGGAIYNINNSTINFTSAVVNFTSNSSAGLLGGGAIYNWENSRINFTSGAVNFAGNSASSSGGAIYNWYNSTINFTSEIVNFMSNT
ncbi:MAG: hypothetical protein LBU09_03695, partial [Endomicrobium sp.]|nr:hypothetical protein [Endomicrobium sp.]